MDKMMVVVFPEETAAYEGLKALKELHARADITLYAAAVVVKDSSGAISVKQAVDPGPLGTAVGMLTGSLVGLLGGPVGAAVGFATGGGAGFVFDLADLGIGASFLDDVSKALGPGKTAVLAEVQETWTTPVDTRLGQLGGVVFRRLRAEVVEEQMMRESDVFAAEMKQYRQAVAQATAATKVAVERDVSAAKARIEATLAHARAKAEQAKREMEAKLAALGDQMKRASEAQKAKIQTRLDAAKADYAVRNAKFEKGGKLLKEALAP
jgi:uncharacterized membrane protein